MSNSMPWEKNWKVIEPLGGGGQGDTFLVQSVTNESIRAVLKLLKPIKANDAKARGRMAQEVTNLRFLRAAGGKVPHVLETNTEQFDDSNVPLFFVMEHIQGTTLAKTVQGSGGLGVQTSIGIALDLSKTMKVAIKEGIIHRDIKPENIIIKSREPADVVMVDFGLSFNEEDTSNLTETEETLDNKFLSLPERRGPGENKRDPRSDLTGICAILFYCLTECSPRNLRDSQGRPPHQWPDYSLSKKIQNPSYVTALDLLLRRGLSYEIDLRFQTIDELINRLEEILKPGSEVAPENLDTVIARETAALRKNDRKTQLAEFFRHAQGLEQSLKLRLNDITRRLGTNKSFYVMDVHNAFNSANEKVAEGELIGRRIFAIGVHNHQLLFQIHYLVIAQGPECAIYRELLDGQFHEQTKQVEKPVLVLRYQEDSLPDASIIVKDLDVGIARAITLLSHRVQSGY
jgi:serine/threonine protein kinase